MSKSRRVTYIPYSKDLMHPGDRRRIKFWADNVGIELNLGVPEVNDLLVLSGGSSLRRVSSCHIGPIVIDLVDGYFSCSDNFFRDFARNSLRSLYGRSSFRSITYSRELKNAIKNANQVIVACPEQAKHVLPYNRNVTWILDSHEELNNKSETSLARRSKKFTLLWEGFGFTLKHLLRISDEIEEFLLEYDSELTLVTNTAYKRWGTRLIDIRVEDEIKRHFRRTWRKIKVVEWSIENLIEEAINSDIAIIPLNSQDCFAMAKSENKLLSFWKLGLPVLCSPSPAYARVSKTSGVNMLVSDGSWRRALTTRLKASNSDFEEEYSIIQNFLSIHHDKKSLIGRWEETLRPLIGST